MAEQSLKDKTVKGAAWSFADNILGLGVSFIIGIILARLLSPEEYGLIGIIAIFISVFDTIVDSGFSNALIRKKDASNTDFNTVFWCNFTLSVILCCTLFLCAGPIAVFFDKPDLVPLTRAMSIIIVINAFAVIQRTILTKRMDFKSQTKVSLISSIASGVIGIVMAFLGCGVWSLVGQQMSRQLLHAILYGVYNRWLPRKEFSWGSFKELFGFGWKLLASQIIATIWSQLSKVVIGRCYTPATLGLYTRAHQFADLFSKNITGVVQRVSYPALSQIQDDRKHLKAAYQKLIKVTMFVSFVLMFGLAGVADNFVYVLVGEKWMECVPMLQIICFIMVLYPLHAINLNMLKVQGRSDLFLKLEIIKKIIAIGPLLLGIYVGIYWMLIANVIVGVFAYYLNAYYSGPFLNYTIWEQIKDILPSMSLGLGMGAIVLVLGMIPRNAFIMLPIQLACGAAIVVGAGELFKMNDYLEIKGLAVDYYGKIKGKSK